MNWLPLSKVNSKRNPLLEREESLIAQDDPLAAPDTATSDDGDAVTLSDREELPSTEAPLDSDYTNVYLDDPFRPTGGNALAARGDIDSLPGIDQIMTSEVTLREHLTEQLGLSIRDPTQRLIGRALIDSLDDRGSGRAARMQYRSGQDRARDCAGIRTHRRVRPRPD